MLIFKDKYVPSIPSGPHDNCPNLEILMHQRRGKYYSIDNHNSIVTDSGSITESGI